MQAGINIGGRNIKNLNYVANTTLIAESKEELMSFLIRLLKEESRRPDLRLNIKTTTTTTKLRSWHLPPLLQGK